jgi:hypothetical protein
MWCKKYQCICDATDCDGTSEDCEQEEEWNEYGDREVE